IKLRNRVSIDIFVTERVGVPLILLKGIAYPNTNFQILNSATIAGDIPPIIRNSSPSSFWEGSPKKKAKISQRT
ncbi:MAG: hypothetical protein ACTSP1_13820, partial [Candidatus Freyarchaeota archaeon]